MFIHFTKPIFGNKDMPKVWVKVKSEIFGNHYGEDAEEVSLFVDNNAMAKVAINPNYKIGLTEKWHITDGYYGQMVRMGEFVPVSDLNEVDGICLEMGYPPYEMDIF